MKKYYCLPVKNYVCVLYNFPLVRLISTKTGEVLGCLTVKYSSKHKNCAYVDTQAYPWAVDWIQEKLIASPTGRSLIIDGFSFPEFLFKKED